MKISRGFRRAGWVDAGGTMLRAIGSAIMVFVFTGPSTLGTWRIRVGARKAILERRAHGTETGRCSAGHWVRVDDAPTPADARGWTRLGKFWASMLREHGSEVGWGWEADSGKDRTRCHTRRHMPEAHDPIPVAACETQAEAERMRGARGNPSRLMSFGYAPASGRRVGTHDHGRMDSMRRARRRAAASRRARVMREARRIRTFHAEESK